MSGAKKQNKAADVSDLIPQVEAARVLGITRAGVAWLISNGRLQTAEMWGRNFVRRSEVLSYKAEKQSRAKTKAKK
jgi:hypothetical protein